MKRLGFDLILLGAPASGKDTQAAILRKKYSFNPVESGKHWRAVAKQDTPAGRLIKRTVIGRGMMAPVAMMKKFLKTRIGQADDKKDLVFVGNPRLKPEAQMLVALLKKARRDFLVIFLALPKKQILIRAKNRHRGIDDTKYINNRIKFHNDMVLKTVDYFRGLNKLKTVDGNRSILQVAAEVAKTIHDYQRSQANRNT